MVTKTEANFFVDSLGEQAYWEHMAKLKSLFGTSLKTPEEKPREMLGSKNRGPSVVARLMGLEALPAEPAATANKQKGVAVPLEKRVPDSNTLVDITVSGKQRLNGGITRSSPKSRSFDGIFDKHHKDVCEVRSVEQGAECLQSIQLDELNRRLLAKHMKVLDDLKEAKQQMSLSSAVAGTDHQQPRKGLSDSSEFLDAMELLQANRQFFEKYFKSAGALDILSRREESTVSSKRENKLPAGKIPRFLSGQSSPRPPVKEQSKVLNADSGRLLGNKKAASPSRDEIHEVSSIVVLKPRRKTDLEDHEAKQEKQTVKDRKDIAKLIAKKIKESISKEVAKTFYSKGESISPQKSPSRTFEKPEDTPRSRHSRSLSQPEENFGESERKSQAGLDSPLKKKLESLSPRSKRKVSGSRDSTASPKNAGSKSQKPVPEKKSKSGSPRNSHRNREVNSPDASPRVSSPKSSVSLDDSPRLSRTRSNKAAPKPSKSQESREVSRKRNGRETAEKKANLKSPRAKPQVKEITSNLEDVWLELGKETCLGKHQVVAEIADDDCLTITPTKTDQQDYSNVTSKHKLKVFADSTSPVSVLDLPDEDEHDRDIAQDGSIAKPVTDLQPLQVAVDIVSPKSSQRPCPPEDLVCPPGRQDDLAYLRKLVTAASSTQKLDEMFGSVLFERLEDEYSQEHCSSEDNAVIDAVQMHLRAINRWLLFDFASEFLSIQHSSVNSCSLIRINTSSSGSSSSKNNEEEGKLLEDLWNSALDHYKLQESGQRNLEALINIDIQNERRRECVEADTGFANVCQVIENSFFNELIDDAIADLVTL